MAGYALHSFALRHALALASLALFLPAGAAPLITEFLADNESILSDKNGEYLGLIAPDGTTVVDEFAPAFPVQFGDASYGLAQLGNTSEEAFLEVGGPCTALVPTDGTLGTSWTAVGFDDGGWIAGSTGVGYERSSGYQNLINIDVEAQMFSTNTSVYVRLPFTVAGANEIAGLELRIHYDDGFVAYLNGVPVAGDRAPANLAWNSAATADHTYRTALPFDPLTTPRRFLRLDVTMP